MTTHSRPNRLVLEENRILFVDFWIYEWNQWGMNELHTQDNIPDIVVIGNNLTFVCLRNWEGGITQGSVISKRKIYSALKI